jgi:hypothetical protein
MSESHPAAPPRQAAHRGYRPADTDQGSSEPGGGQVIGGHHYVHGRPASWVLVTAIIAAFLAGGIAIIARQWVLFWVCAGIVVLSVPAGALIGIMHDTVLDDGPADDRPVAEDTGSAADPGVKI